MRRLISLISPIEVAPRHLPFAQTEVHDLALLLANPGQHRPDRSHHRIEDTRGELEELEDITHGLQGFVGRLAATTMGFQRLLAGFEPEHQVGKTACGLFWIGTGIDLALLALFGDDVGGQFSLFLDDRHHLLDRQRDDRIEITADQLGQAALTHADPGIFIEHLANGAGIAGHRTEHLAHTLFDALGNDDLTFTGQQVDAAHFAHVHPHRIGGATDLALHGSQHCDGFGGRSLIRGGIAFGHHQGVDIGGLLKDTNPHVVDHLDDLFDLIRVGNVLRQVVVHLRVGQETLLPSPGDEHFDTGLLLFHFGHCTPLAKWSDRIGPTKSKNQRFNSDQDSRKRCSMW
jgi:hypothetical protein